jgi:phage baseplate assembly protein gpV
MFYWHPAVVKSYMPEKHRARVEILGLTDNNTGIYPEAEIAYAIGDVHYDTETLIQPGDAVWVAFAIDGDVRIPIITAYRNPPTGNMVGTRRFRQKNIELIATDSVKVSAPNILIQSSNTTLDHTQLTATGTNTLQGQTNLDGGATTTTGSAPVISGGINVQGGAIEHDGTDIGKTHVHITGQPGGNTSTPV